MLLLKRRCVVGEAVCVVKMREFNFEWDMLYFGHAELLVGHLTKGDLRQYQAIALLWNSWPAQSLKEEKEKWIEDKKDYWEWLKQ